jgi:DNA helicase-2/ATP-dependent DNA helicase PcrA
MPSETMSNKNLLDRLNPAQAEAVTHTWGPTLVIAGAGSGKTTALTRRIAYLIAELNQDPESILSVTFTNKAAAEMKARIESIVGYDQARRISIGTFHSTCARLLRSEIDAYTTPEGWQWSRNFVIYDETDSLNTLKAQLKKLNLDEKVFSPKEVRYAISSAKNDGLTAHQSNQNARTYRETRIAEIYSNYQAELARSNALDFDDLILVFNQLLYTNPEVKARLRERFRHILVDEFQDTNKTQYDLVISIGGVSRSLNPASEHPGDKLRAWQERSLMVVGDVDQSIYSWRKADFRIILGFQNDFPESKLIKLEENYRSTNNILEVANSIIANNSERIEKVLRCNRGSGSKSQCYEASDEIDEAYYVVEELKRLKARGRNYSDCVILYRTNAQSRAIEEVLVRSHIPYTVYGATRFYDRQEIKDVLGYLKLIFNERDSQAFLRVVNVPRRGLGKTTIDRLVSHAERASQSLIEAAGQADNLPEVSEKSAKALRDFASQVARWQLLSRATSVSALLEMVLKETRYIEKLEEDAQTSRDELAIGRIENVRELLNVAKEFEALADQPDLASFLTRISLVSDLDTSQADQDVVKMMTLHLAKGLEFPIVFLMGLEEGLFPHIRSFDSPQAMEEERRLMYVGVTRAADMLFITYARRRMILGRTANSGGFSANYSLPSRFLKEIGAGLLSGYYPETRVPDKTVTVSGAISNIPSQRSLPLTKPRAMRSERQALIESPSAQPDLFQHLKVGDTVQHQKFGIGQITAVIGEQDKELYNIEFQGAGKRLLDPRYAKLIKMS